jgi:hypothetical protein
MPLNQNVSTRDNATNNVQALRKKITYLNDGVAVTVGKIPAGSIIIGAGVIVSTAFNAGSTNVVDIGTSLDDDGFGTDLALGTVGNIVWDELATSDDLYSASDVTITATVALTGTASTAGEARVYVLFIAPN